MEEQNQNIIDSGAAPPESFERLAGKLDHVSIILPAARNFVGRIYHTASKPNHFLDYLITQEIENDFILWLSIIDKAPKCIAINNLFYRNTQVVATSDARKHGLGDFNSQVLVWQLELPVHLQGRFFLALLESMTTTFTVVETIQENKHYLCIQIRSNSSTTLSWLYKTRFWIDDENNRCLY